MGSWQLFGAACSDGASKQPSSDHWGVCGWSSPRVYHVAHFSKSVQTTRDRLANTFEKVRLVMKGNETCKGLNHAKWSITSSYHQLQNDTAGSSASPSGRMRVQLRNLLWGSPFSWRHRRQMLATSQGREHVLHTPVGGQLTLL
jgi:hypothetical protein